MSHAERSSGEQTAIADKWTPVHAASGVLAGALGVPIWGTIAIGVGYELLEFAHESPRGSRVFGTKRPESAENILGDLVAFVAGGLAGQALRKKLKG